MEVLRDGKFTITIGSDKLSRGLRKKSSQPRDVHYMENLSGLVSKDGVLQAQSTLSRIDTSIITDDFPYPQIFVLADLILVCGETKIYEYDGSMNLKLTTTAGNVWKVVDFISYLYLSNGKVAVIRNASDGSYEVSDLPIANAMCNYNGQVIIGAPGVEVS